VLGEGDASLLADVTNGDDVGVVDATCRPRLLLEATPAAEPVDAQNATR
jgi:hypothetical protein